MKTLGNVIKLRQKKPKKKEKRQRYYVKLVLLIFVHLLCVRLHLDDERKNFPKWNPFDCYAVLNITYTQTDTHISSIEIPISVNIVLHSLFERDLKKRANEIDDEDVICDEIIYSHYIVVTILEM